MFHYIPIHVPLNHLIFMYGYGQSLRSEKNIAAFFTLSLAFSRAAASASGAIWLLDLGLHMI